MIRGGSVVALLLFLLAGCHESGAWQDDPRNFERVFGVEKPGDVEVVRSWFWRSPHWTYEFAYFLQIRANDGFCRLLIGKNKLRRTGAGEEIEIMDFGDRKPEWFIPGQLDQYEVWVYADGSDSRFRVFIDRKTGDIFLSDYQL